MILKFTDLFYKPSTDFPSDIVMYFVHRDSAVCLVFESSLFKIIPSAEIKINDLNRYDFGGNNRSSEIEIIGIKVSDNAENTVYILCKDKSIIKIYCTQDNYEGSVFQCFSVYMHDNIDELNQSQYDQVMNEFLSLKNARIIVVSD